MRLAMSRIEQGIPTPFEKLVQWSHLYTGLSIKLTAQLINNRTTLKSIEKIRWRGTNGVATNPNSSPSAIYGTMWRLIHIDFLLKSINLPQK